MFSMNYNAFALGLLPYFGLMWPVLSALLPVRKI